MKQICDVGQMQEESLGILKAGKKHGFVPTMGNLHEGHASLIRQARSECEIVTASIFVNPTQFNEADDFEKYPRTLEEDMEKAYEAGADIVFCPPADAVYAGDRDVVIVPDKLANHLCGLSRGRGHFIGVCTIVAKLFNIVRPDVAYFGQKDAQQVLIIQRMIRDLNFPIKISVCPIVREDDGLAMSSRNNRLSDSQREEALSLYSALCIGRDMISGGEKKSSNVINAMAEHILSCGDIEVDYIDIVDTETLDDVDTIDDLVLMAGAIKLGDVRLIDNLLVAPDN